jgi:hypothetical protein
MNLRFVDTALILITLPTTADRHPRVGLFMHSMFGNQHGGLEEY